MRIRLIEEYDPIRDTTIWYAERTIFGVWLGIFSVIDGSCDSRQHEARQCWERFKKCRSTKKARKIIDRATL